MRVWVVLEEGEVEDPGSGGNILVELRVVCRNDSGQHELCLLECVRVGPQRWGSLLVDVCLYVLFCGFLEDCGGVDVVDVPGEVFGLILGELLPVLWAGD